MTSGTPYAKIRDILPIYKRKRTRSQPEKIIVFGTPFPEMKGNIVAVDYLSSRKVCADMGGRGTFAAGNPVDYTLAALISN